MLRLVRHIIFLVAFVAVVSTLPSKQKATPNQDGKAVICYFTNWATYRNGDASYDPEDIDPTLCTHIVYGFATLNNNTLEMEPFDPWMDIDQGFYERVTAFKAQGVKVSIALGGWNDSEGDKYSRMVNDPDARANFVQKALEFVQMYNFDGLDLDWEYPKCWQGDCDAGPDSDKENFANLVRELRTAFQPHGLLLSSAVGAQREVAENGYDIPALAENLDWIGLMNYDYHGAWDNATGFNSPLHGDPPNTDDSVVFWLSNGAPASKLVIGIPMYGRSFTLDDPSNTEPGAPASAGRAGEYTGEAGFLAFYELCNWQSTNVPDIEDYAVEDDQWASYDSEQTIVTKAQYIVQRGLMGGMIWALDLDDFHGNFCNKEAYPLLRTLRENM